MITKRRPETNASSAHGREHIALKIPPDIKLLIQRCQGDMINASARRCLLHLDNLAWVLYYELKLNQACASVTESRKQTIGLTNESFVCALRKKGSAWNNCATTLASKPKTDWIKTIATQRDPAAHRLPIEMPLGCVQADKRSEYNELQRKIKEAGVDQIYALHCEADKCAQFNPCLFIQDASGGGQVAWLFDEIIADTQQLFDTVRTVLCHFAQQQPGS